MVISAEIMMFLPKVVYFGRNKTVSAETRLFLPNIRFRPNFGFCEWPVSVFGVSAKNLFRSDTMIGRRFFRLQCPCLMSLNCCQELPMPAGAWGSHLCDIRN